MTDNSTTAPQSPPGGVSGKRVTIWVVLALLGIGIGLSATLWTYNSLDAARAASAAAWRATTPLLDQRYRALEQQLAKAAAESTATVDFQQRFESAVDRFRTTSIAVDQVAAAENVEQLLGSSGFPKAALRANPPTTQLLARLADYNQQRLRERSLRESFGGRMLELFLSLPASTPFHLATPP